MEIARILAEPSIQRWVLGNMQDGTPAAGFDFGLQDALPAAVAEAAGGSAATGLVQYISFAVGNEQYGIDIMSVREIKGWSGITALPKQPDYVRGVMNLRGVIVPIFDLRCRFGLGLSEATPSHVVIIVQIGARMVGLLADRVLDIVNCEVSQVQPVPRVTQASRLDFLSGLITIEGTMIALIDLPNLLALPGAESEEQPVTH